MKKLKKYQKGSEVDSQKEWLRSYMSSPMYLSRLRKEFGYGVPIDDIIAEQQNRLSNLDRVGINYVKQISESGPGWISGEYHPDKFLPHQQLRGNSWENYIPESDLRHQINLESEYNPKSWNPYKGFETTPIHELSHAVDQGGYRIPAHTNELISKLTKSDKVDIDGNPLAINKIGDLEYGYANYPTEFIGRLQPIRYLLNKNNIYNTAKEEFTEEHFKKMMENPEIRNNIHFQQLMEVLKGGSEQKKKEFIYFMNNIAAVEDQQLPTAKGGMSVQGYKSNSPDRFNSMNMIPSNRITMQGVPHPVLAFPMGGNRGAGNPVLMQPGEEYFFPNHKMVVEFPVPGTEGMQYQRMQQGGPIRQPLPPYLENRTPSPEMMEYFKKMSGSIKKKPAHMYFGANPHYGFVGGNFFDKYSASVGMPKINSKYAPQYGTYKVGYKMPFQQGGEPVKYGTPEYEEAYKSGRLATYDPVTDTYATTPLETVEITAEAPDYVKFREAAKKTWPEQRYFDERVSTPLGRAMGETGPDVWHPNVQRRYDDFIKDLTAAKILEKYDYKNQYSNDRVKWLEQLSPKEKEILHDSKYSHKISPNLWARTWAGITKIPKHLYETAKTMTLPGMIYKAGELAGSWEDPIATTIDKTIYGTGVVPNLTPDEYEQANILDAAAAIEVPVNMLQAGLRRDSDIGFWEAASGQEDINTPEDALWDIAGDPLNLLGLGIFDALKSGKLGNVGKYINKLKSSGRADEAGELERLLEAYNRSIEGMEIPQIRTQLPTSGIPETDALDRALEISRMLRSRPQSQPTIDLRRTPASTFRRTSPTEYVSNQLPPPPEFIQLENITSPTSIRTTLPNIDDILTRMDAPPSSQSYEFPVSFHDQNKAFHEKGAFKPLQDVLNKNLETGMGIKKGRAKDMPIEIRIEGNDDQIALGVFVRDEKGIPKKSGTIRLNSEHDSQGKFVGFSKGSDYPTGKMTELENTGIGAEIHQAIKKTLKSIDPKYDLYSSTTHVPKGGRRYLREYLNDRVSLSKIKQVPNTEVEIENWKTAVDKIKAANPGKKWTTDEVDELLKDLPYLRPTMTRFKYPFGGKTFGYMQQGGFYNPIPESVRAVEPYNPGNWMGMVKSKIAYENEFGNNPAIKRMISPNFTPYIYPGGFPASHYMGSYGRAAIPNVQEVDGRLTHTGPRMDEAIMFYGHPAQVGADARYFAENYKKVAPTFQPYMQEVFERYKKQ